MRPHPRLLSQILSGLDPWLFFLLALGVALALTSDVRAQAPGTRAAPHLAFTYPAGGQQGTTFTVSVGGQNLLAAAAAYFSGSGISAKITGYERPLTQKEINDLREKLQTLQDKRTAARTDKTKPSFTAEDEKAATDIRTALATRGNRQISPVLAETVTLEVTLAPDAMPGEREFRLHTPNGLSNPMVFCVGQLPEFSEPVQIATANLNRTRPTREIDPLTQRPKTEMTITLPALMNGQVLPGEVDHFHFAARKGQRIVMVASARALLPYLADAVPGWFQATLGLLDANGRELAYNDDYRFNPDPVLCYEIPADGNYVAEIKDAIFRGREDFVYRVAIGELPFVTSIYPLGATIGPRATFELAGWNLPSTALAMETNDKQPGTFLLSVRGHGQLSNPVRIVLDSPAGCVEVEPNDRPDSAQTVSLPTTVDGRIERPNGRDVFRFEGKAGDEIVAEVWARRLGSPLDSVLRLTDGTGQQVGFNDDSEDKSAGLLTHHADSRLACKLPADGIYYLTLADTQHQGGPEYSYRLRLGPPRPDFDLRVAPSSINLRAGASGLVTVYALRHDGFSGEIMLQLRDPPRGFVLSGARIPANQEKIQVTLTAPFSTTDQILDLAMVGVATIDGKPVAHKAVPAEDMMQAFAYRHLVTTKELKVDVAGRGAPFRVLTRGPVQLAPGGNVRVQIAAPAGRTVGKIHFELVDPPDGIAIEKSTVGFGDTVTVVLTCDATKVKPGSQGNLLLTGFGERPGNKAANKGARVPLGAVPAIPFEVTVSGAPST